MGLRRDPAMVIEGSPELSIVIPVLDEAARIEAAFTSLPKDGGGIEVLVVDGGSRDGTLEAAERARPRLAARGIPLHLLSSVRGRGIQMNAGAARARGAVLLFLHADTLLPADALPAVRRALSRPGVVGGGFRHRFREGGLRLGMVSSASNLRSRLRGTFYGDQAIFVRRSAFEALGGFLPVPIFEDVEFSARMRRAGRTVLLPVPIRTSGRRFLSGGVVRTAWRMARMKAAYLWGRDPEVVVGDYWDERRRGGGAEAEG